jgi:hypothetical protein
VSGRGSAPKKRESYCSCGAAQEKVYKRKRVIRAAVERCKRKRGKKEPWIGTKE